MIRASDMVWMIFEAILKISSFVFFQAVESSIPAHNSLAGQCRKSAWSSDSKYIVSVTDDSSIIVFQTK